MLIQPDVSQLTVAGQSFESAKAHTINIMNRMWYEVFKAPHNAPEWLVRRSFRASEFVRGWHRMHLRTGHETCSVIIPQKTTWGKVYETAIHELTHAAVGGQHKHDMVFRERLSQACWDAFGVYVVPKQEDERLYGQDERLRTALAATYEWANIAVGHPMDRETGLLRSIAKWKRRFGASTVEPEPVAALKAGYMGTFLFIQDGKTVGQLVVNP